MGTDQVNCCYATDVVCFHMRSISAGAAGVGVAAVWLVTRTSTADGPPGVLPPEADAGQERLVQQQHADVAGVPAIMWAGHCQSHAAAAHMIDWCCHGSPWPTRDGCAAQVARQCLERLLTAACCGWRSDVHAVVAVMQVCVGCLRLRCSPCQDDACSGGPLRAHSVGQGWPLLGLTPLQPAPAACGHQLGHEGLKGGDVTASCC